MKHIYTITTAIALLMATSAMAQRVEVIDGTPDALRGVKKLNVKYDYSNMNVGKKTEKDYVQEKRDGYNSKEPGKGDKWVQDWKADRESRFEPAFEDGFNKNGEMQTGYFPKERYTIIFKTTNTEPGYNIGVMAKNASIDGEAWIVETANPDKVIAKLEVAKCPGRQQFGDEYGTGLRIEEAYTSAGRGLARYFRKYSE